MSWLTEKEIRERDPDYCRFCPGGQSKEWCDRCQADRGDGDDDTDDSETEDN